MNRREFVALGVVVGTIPEVVIGQTVPPMPIESEVGGVDGDYRTAVLYPTGVHYLGHFASKANILIAGPKEAAVIAGYTKFDREDDGKWGIDEFHGAKIARIDPSVCSAIQYYRQLEDVTDFEWRPCLLRLPKPLEEDFWGDAHCETHGVHSPSCESCRKILDEMFPGNFKTHPSEEPQ